MYRVTVLMEKNLDTEFPFLVEAHEEVVTQPEFVFMNFILTQLYFYTCNNSLIRTSNH
jgi:hypothetical protein